jgi:hypothetical protein
MARLALRNQAFVRCASALRQKVKCMELQTADDSRGNHSRKRLNDAVNKLHQLFEDFDNRPPFEHVWFGKDVVDMGVIVRMKPKQHDDM